jgi:FkbM family methyltransferase
MTRAPIALPDLLWAAWRRRKWRGFHRAWGWRIARGGARELLARSSYGPVFALDPLGYLDGFVLDQGFYESEVFEALRPELARGGVLWDIGANIGLHAVTAKVLFPAANVCAFEPAPTTMARLQRNAALNAVQPGLFTCALSDRPGIAVLHLGDQGNPGMSTLSPWSAYTYAGTCHVSTCRGDDLVANGAAPLPNVIKLDVEGHEPAVLRGLASVLRAPECRLAVFEDGLEPDTETKRLLTAAGFKIRRLDRREATAHVLANFAAEKS